MCALFESHKILYSIRFTDIKYIYTSKSKHVKMNKWTAKWQPEGKIQLELFTTHYILHVQETFEMNHINNSNNNKKPSQNNCLRATTRHQWVRSWNKWKKFWATTFFSAAAFESGSIGTISSDSIFFCDGMHDPFV